MRKNKGVFVVDASTVWSVSVNKLCGFVGHSRCESSVDQTGWVEDGRERKKVNFVTRFCGVAKHKSVTKKKIAVSPRER